MEWWETCHRSHQWLTDGNYICLRKQALEALPVLFVGEGISVGSHRLIYVHSQRSVKLFGHSCHFGQTQIVRLHHDRDDGHGYSQPHATLRLSQDQLPVAWSALCILFLLRRVIKRELDIV